MASTASGHVTSGSAADKTQVSCLGFAGQGGGSARATYIQVDFDWAADWTNPAAMTLTLSGLRFRTSDGGGLLDSQYHWYLCVMPTGSQTMGIDVPSNALWSQEFYYSYGGTGSTRKPLDYSPSGTYTVPLGAASDWGFDTSGNMLVWFGGCSTYTVTDPVYPQSQNIALASDPPIAELMRYFPCAVKKGTQWLSCNRPGGTLQRLIGSTWTNRRNNEASDTPAENRVFIKKGNAWAKSAKIGSGA